MRKPHQKMYLFDYLIMHMICTSGTLRFRQVRLIYLTLLFVLCTCIMYMCHAVLTGADIVRPLV